MWYPNKPYINGKCIYSALMYKYQFPQKITLIIGFMVLGHIWILSFFLRFRNINYLEM